ncbi:S-ribosylhomocysteine lyase [Ruminococcaceae bacterium OttesenSCG-928-D13]|nr:S-ribosylhomocysteine lyase [Ruminococcaceae bacterium OttesenSCG-928-D13]
MERIASFSVNHDKLKKGMYTSRVDSTDIITYDIRMKEPNQGDYLSTGGAHTMEHLFATYARNSPISDRVIYVGPMGCRTGFYLVTKGLSHQDAIWLVRQSMLFIRDFKGDIPGATQPECGNYADQNLDEAHKVAADMSVILDGWTPDKLEYQFYLD